MVGIESTLSSLGSNLTSLPIVSLKQFWMSSCFDLKQSGPPSAMNTGDGEREGYLLFNNMEINLRFHTPFNLREVKGESGLKENVMDDKKATGDRTG